MTLFISQSLLWLVVLLLAGAVVALARQVGVLHSRISPVGALSIGKGPQPGESAPELTVRSLDDTTHRIGGRSDGPRLLFFVSPTCPICKALFPTVQSVATAERLELLLIGDGDPAELRDLADRFSFPADRFINNMEIGRAFHVGKLPYAVLLDEGGIIAAQGLVNNREHVESLAVAHETKLHSIQQYLRQREEGANRSAGGQPAD